MEYVVQKNVDVCGSGFNGVSPVHQGDVLMISAVKTGAFGRWLYHGVWFRGV